MRRLVVLALLLGLMALLQTLQVGTEAALQPLSLATFGFILLAAYTLGQVAANLQLPKITGYIVTGLVFGPQVFNVFSSAVEADLRVVNDLAIGLIALSAGAEMQLSGLRRIARSLLWIVLVKGLLILAAVTATVFALASFLPFLSGQPTGLVLSVGMILGVLAIGTSPAATIAVITETGAKGRLADTTLGVAVAKDIVMVVLLALAIALARTFSPDGHGFEVAILGELAIELGLSLLAGAILGGLIIAYVRFVGAELWLFVVGIIFAMTAVAAEFHLEALLVFIVAGFVVQNASTLGHDFVDLVEKVALPIYVVFFSVAGAGLDLLALRSVLLVALALVTVRLIAIFVGTNVATRLADEPEPIRKYAWMSFVAQAGVVIGLSIIVEDSLPGLGTEIRTLVMGTVAIHLLLGPILFKIALTRAGEVRRLETEEEAAPALADERTEASLTVLGEELATPFEELRSQVLGALENLAEAGEQPLQVARALEGWPRLDRLAKEEDVSTPWARDLTHAMERFFSEVHAITLSVPRQLRVEMEGHWFQNNRWDTPSQRWTKRLRRWRRRMRSLLGAEPLLHRVVPVRALALYHIDNLVAEDLRPALSALAARPAFELREQIKGELQGGGVSDGAASDDPPQSATDALVPVVENRFRELKRELAKVGTAELPTRRRRPSALHERAQRARARTGEAILAWQELAQAVIGYVRRQDAIEDLRTLLRRDSAAFRADLEERFQEVSVAPVQRARHVLEEAVQKVDALRGEGSEAIEGGLLEISEWVSVSLRRQALAGLRRGVEARPVYEVLRRFDDQVEEQLTDLPEEFRVVDPNDLPDPARLPRTYPEPANHEFKLIATGTVERTLKPSLAQFAERGGKALSGAAAAVQEVREGLEARLDAAVDAAVEEGRTGRAAVESEPRESIHIAQGALGQGLDSIDAALTSLESVGREGLDTFREDFLALSERLGTQLRSARPLSARLQAERARVELGGLALARRFWDTLASRMNALLERLGVRNAGDSTAKDGGEGDEPYRFKPAGRAGSDRAVLFNVLFDDSTPAGKFFGATLIFTIIASIVVLMLESVEPIRLAHGRVLSSLEWLFTLLFTIEYIARLWAVDRPVRYALSFFGVVDLLALIPTYLSLLIPGGQYLMGIRVLRVMRAFRILKLARYVGEANVLTDALRASRYKITVFLVMVLSVAVVMGSAMYLIEGPEAGFTSIPRGVYWSIVTLTTVGFGDITPQTPLGQTLAATLMVLGYAIIAIPTGIVSAEIAKGPQRGKPGRHCPECSHRETNAAAVFCIVCGSPLDD